ncbi:MAG: hypothetical protein ACTS2F_23545 [Thainema sp.]
MENHSLFDWISVVGPMLLSWPLVIALVLVFFRKPLFNLLEKVSGNNVQKAKIGPFEIEEAKQTYVESLKLLLTSFVSPNELKQLQQLDEENGDGRKNSLHYEITPECKGALKRLQTIDFLEVRTNLDELPETGQLNQHVKLTEKGKRYLYLRDDLLHDDLAVGQAGR